MNREPPASRNPRAGLKLALEASERAGYKNPGYLDTLSLAYHLNGDTAKAIENQNTALALLPDGESRMRTALEESLSKFEAAQKN